jgi:Flp pilus assembly protein TadG
MKHRMFKRIRRALAELRRSTSGNAAILVAAGMPALIGGAGLAVDTAQWYMWKREMQYAVDQAAIAGAWSKVKGSEGTEYQTRAVQELNANLQVVDFHGTPGVALADYNQAAGEADNSVVVTLSASKALPFSSMLMGQGATISVRAQATFANQASFTVCMLSVDPTADSAFKFGGSVTGSTDCGAGTLSDDDNAAMKEVGNTDVPIGNLVARGGIDEDFTDNGTLYPDEQGLSDPYASLDTPSAAGSTAQTYTCPPVTEPTDVTRADVTTRTIKTYTYYRGSNATAAVTAGSYTYTSGTGYLANSDVTDGPTETIVANGTVEDSSVTVGPTTSSPLRVTGSGANQIFRTETTTVTTTNDNVTVTTETGSDGIARPQPGIYDSLVVACQTEFTPGIYFIGGDLDFGQNFVVTGSGVLFVMTGGGGAIHINANSDITLSGITEATLTGAPYNYPDAYAEKVAGMLLFDRVGDDAFTLNGSSVHRFDGTFYMPLRDTTFNGDSYAAGGCMQFVSRTMEILGNFNITNFCTPSNSNGGITIGSGTHTVRLVA